MTGLMQFGMMCLKMILALLVPMVSAACTNLRSLMETACPRTRRVYQGHQETTMAIMAFVRPEPSSATKAIARSSGGNDRKISVIRIMTLSIHPPNTPAMAPSGIPISRATPTATRAVEMDTRVA